MSFLSGGGSAPKQPKLKQLSPLTAETAAVSQDTNAYANAFQNWSTGFTKPLFQGEAASINQAIPEQTGNIGSLATNAVKTAGLGDVPLSGKTPFQEAVNLNKPILSEEQRSRNFTEELLAENPEQFRGLSPDALVQIMLGNTGNVNAVNLAGFQSASNAYAGGLLQQGQLAQGIANLTGGAAKAYTNFNQPTASPYTDPFLSSYIYGNTPPPSFPGFLDTSYAGAPGG